MENRLQAKLIIYLFYYYKLYLCVSNTADLISMRAHIFHTRNTESILNMNVVMVTAGKKTKTYSKSILKRKMTHVITFQKQ